jgi:predicted RNase H-like HicB family nuclease
MDGRIMSLRIITQQEDDGRWIAEVPSLNGVMVYGSTRDAAVENVKELARLVIEDRIENRESLPAHSGSKSFEVWEDKFETASSERLFKGLLRAGWTIKREKKRFKVLSKESQPDFVFAFDEKEKIRIRMLDWITKAGARPKDF